MNIALMMAGLVAVVMGIVHSMMGEARFFRTLINRRDIDGDPVFSPRQFNVLRGTWHTLSLFGFGLAGVFFTLAVPVLTQTIKVQGAVAITCLIVGIFWAWITRFWHPVWIAFVLLAALTWWS